MACLDCAGPSKLRTASFCNRRESLQASCRFNGLLKSATKEGVLPFSLRSLVDRTLEHQKGR